MCWHKWGKWQDVRSGVLHRSSLISGQLPKEQGEALAVPNGDYYVEQKRTCEKCGKTVLRTEIA